MISDQTHRNFQTLMHKLNSESYMFSGIAAAFRSGGHMGMAAFASWEGSERWEYAKKIRDCIEKMGLKATFPALAESRTDYPDPTAALTAMVAADMATLKFMDTGMKQAGDAKEWYAVKKMAWIYGKMLKQYNEVNNILKRIKMAANDPAAIIEINENLYEKYSEKSKY